MGNYSGEFFAVVIISLLQLAAVAVSTSFVLGAFSLPQCTSAKFEDDGLLFAQITALILTTPWNVDRRLPKIFVYIISATLFFTFTTSIIISENSIEEIRQNSCTDSKGKKGAYYSLVFINLAVFIHTAVLWGYRIATL